MDYKDFISKRITELRLSKDISSRALSLDLGLSNSYITQIENKDKMPSIENLVKICEYFNITVGDFFNPVISNRNTELSRLTTDQVDKLNEFVKSLKDS